jgi:hypothetical protein
VTGIEERIRQVVAEHSYAEFTGRCGCGLEVGFGDRYDQGYEKHAAHVAAVVAQALQPTITAEQRLDAIRKCAEHWRDKELDPWVDCDCGACVKKEFAAAVLAILDSDDTTGAQ